MYVGCVSTYYSRSYLNLQLIIYILICVYGNQLCIEKMFYSHKILFTRSYYNKIVINRDQKTKTQIINYLVTIF